MGSNLPATPPGLDRKAVERVLARATELQGTTANLDPGETIDEGQLLEIAKEVGLSPENIYQALAEERTRVALDNESDRSWLTRFAGPTSVSASRVIIGAPAALLQALDSWMQREECMQVQRRFNDRMVWEERNDWVGMVKRGLHIGGRKYHLSRSKEVAATVVTVDAIHTLVRLDVNIESSRSKHIGGSTVIGAGGIAASGTFITLGAIAHVIVIAALAAAVVPVSAAAAGIYFTLRHQQDFAMQTKVALEQVLDNLEFTNTQRPHPLVSALTGGRPLL